MKKIVGYQSKFEPPFIPVIASHPWKSAATATHAPAGAKPKHSPSHK